MGTAEAGDVWASGDAYEPYVGRWSRAVAHKFLIWLAAPPGGQWLDVGCGTGALSRSILEETVPTEVVGIDRSPGYIAYAEQSVSDSQVRFMMGDARALPFSPATFDGVVSGLVLNFVSDPAEAIAEMARVTRSGGIVGVYVWDYAGGMELIRRFWNAAADLDPSAHELDEGRRFAAICQPEALADLFHNAGLRYVKTRALDVPTVFRDFDDYWSPFLGGQGPAPGYAMSLSAQQRAALRERIQADLPCAADGTIPLMARAWAAQGER